MNNFKMVETTYRDAIQCEAIKDLVLQGQTLLNICKLVCLHEMSLFIEMKLVALCKTSF